MITGRGKREIANVDLRPDGWERFRRAVGAAAKSGPKHRASVANESKSKQPKAARSRSGQNVKVHRQDAGKRPQKQKGKHSEHA